MRRSMRQLFSSDRGASMILVAASLLLLMGASAVAVDLAAMRLDRSADQKVTDSAASAGALAALDGTGQDACEAALAYVEVNAQEIGTIDASGCAAAFPSPTCNPGSAVPHTVPVGRFNIIVWYPVPDIDPLMTSAQLGAPTQPVVADDGDPCERVGVQMSAVRESQFAQLIGFDQGTTTVHSVARSFVPPPDGPPLNLAVLDRTGCDAIHVTGAPGSGVFVDAVVDPDTGDLFPGGIVADSNASSPFCSTAVIRMEGSNVSLQADGPPGCPDELATGPGDGCGSIEVVADNPTPPCSPPACTAGGGNQPDPAPTKRSDPITRAQIDYEYNCWGDYENPPGTVQWASPPLTGIDDQYIDPCTRGTQDHIYDLIDTVRQAPNTPPLFVRWTSFDPDCLIDSGDPDLILPSEDIHVDCSHLIIKRHVQINGNIIFDGDVTVEGGVGHLDINNSLGAPGWAFFRGGTLTKKGQAALTFNYTMVYMARASQVFMEAGSGRITWQAPDSGSFDDLALWTDSSILQHFAGQNDLTMVGVFFMPFATAEYRGSSGQNQTDAQWVAHRLLATGGAALVVTPKFEFPFKVDSVPRTTIIR